MPRMYLNDMLQHARRHAYAVGAFNVASFAILDAVMVAAEQCRAPVVLNIPEQLLTQSNSAGLLAAIHASAQHANVPVAVCLDHATCLESVIAGIKIGCNAVMIDASTRPLDENFHLTRSVTELAHACDVSVESELGYIPWANSGQTGKTPDSVKANDTTGPATNPATNPGPDTITYTQPAEAKAFAERTSIDCLAVSIGTVHGLLQGSPKLDLARLSKIHDNVSIPLVIHGGTGLSDEQHKKLIAHGVAKINYHTALNEIAGRSIRAQLDKYPDGDYPQLTGTIQHDLINHLSHLMRLWGSGGRAAEILQQCRPWNTFTRIDILAVEGRTSLPDQTTTPMQQAAILGDRIADARWQNQNSPCHITRYASRKAAEWFATQHAASAQIRIELEE